MCTELLASMLEQEDVAVLQDQNMSVLKTHRHAQRLNSSRDHTRPPSLSFAV